MNEIEKLILLSNKKGKELAPLLRTTEARISEYKNGKRGISVRKLREWCKILEIDIKELF
ncbi:helix-turn-helix domain-containing protein [Chryseobacterium indologenes]|uniref:Transcriptional regulator n=1 Tax=Chryseobacterium indologenes TaxID=253 RepID=A0A0N0ZXX4_CHRID|nr:helix-turn-helix transcriptional regulator [Chryseobacterium indologenes]KPE51019.1 transcriptional regulator [Chryseobacterium indologenes]